MLRLLTTFAVAFIMITSSVRADYTLIVPQKPSGGTSVWAQIVVAEWEKHLGENGY